MLASLRIMHSSTGINMLDAVQVRQYRSGSTAGMTDLTAVLHLNQKKTLGLASMGFAFMKFEDKQYQRFIHQHQEHWQAACAMVLPILDLLQPLSGASEVQPPLIVTIPTDNIL